MRLVLDANVFVSSFFNPNGKPSQIMKIILSRKAELIYNSAILSEYENVMSREKFSKKINSCHTLKFINLIRSIAISFSPLPSKTKLRNESERIYFDTARNSGAALITCNLKHFPKKPYIMPPELFLKQFHVYV